MRGTPHADRIQTVNGKRDIVSCGRGHDLATVDGLDRVARDCEVVTREISTDPYSNAPSQHATEVEPDSASWGSTVVAVFQVGRIADGGAANIGFAVSRNRGRTWKHGLLPSLTRASRPAGRWPRASDPSVVYDALHGVWLTVSLAFGNGRSALAISRSADGVHWQAPVIATQHSGINLDKEWITCDDWSSSPYRGRCYLSYDDLISDQIETQFSSDGGLTWSAPLHAPGAPGRTSIHGNYAPGVQPVVRPDGMVVIPYYDETQMAVIRSSDGGLTWLPAAPIAPASNRSQAGLRSGGPMPSAEVGADGAVYLAWADCSRRAGCAANDILVARSLDGITWQPPVRVPTGSANTALPGIAADPSRPGRVALAYYVNRNKRLDVYFVSSRNGGTTWTKPQRLSSRSTPLAWTADAGGAMVGDYISTSFAGGKAVPVFVLATAPTRGSLHEAAFATSLTVN